MPIIKTPWPVWSGSSRAPVQFQPLPKRVAVQHWHDARRLERQTRQPGKQDGALGRNGLAVLHALLFDLIDRATGRAEPTRTEIARAACISVRSVDRGLAKLKEAGVINWIRQCTEDIENGIFRLRQKASAYFVLAQSAWRGFWLPPAAPAPYPEAWGQTLPLPAPIAMVSPGASVATIVAALESDPHDTLALAVARLGRGVAGRSV